MKSKTQLKKQLEKAKKVRDAIKQLKREMDEEKAKSPTKK